MLVTDTHKKETIDTPPQTGKETWEERTNHKRKNISSLARETTKDGNKKFETL